jgi:hypothetical protein
MINFFCLEIQHSVLVFFAKNMCFLADTRRAEKLVIFLSTDKAYLVSYKWTDV